MITMQFYKPSEIAKKGILDGERERESA